jgi:hypothetical protein
MSILRSDAVSSLGYEAIQINGAIRAAVQDLVARGMMPRPGDRS